MKKQKGFGVIEVVVAMAVILLIGGFGWYALGSRTKTSKSDGMKQTSLTQGTTTVTVTHPASWQVEAKTTDEGGWISKKVWIKSDKGHYLHIFNNSGVGGSCPPNNTSYTLTKKIAAASPGIYFTQYTVANDGPQYFGIEDFANRKAENTTQEVGDTAKDTCSLPSYNTVGPMTSEDGVFVTLSNNEKVSLAGDLLYPDLQNDPAYVTMLQSLLVKH